MRPSSHGLSVQQQLLLATGPSSSSPYMSRDTFSPLSQSSANTVTPPPDKPLPAVPSRSSSSPPMTRSSIRSSSIYSRATNFWGPSPPSDHDIESMPVDFFLQPAFYQSYSTSTPELRRTKPDGQTIEPRQFSPLIPSPSSSPSLSDSAPPAPRPSILLPPTPAIPKLRGDKHSTVRANVSQDAAAFPGTLTSSPLLPEEFRATAKARPRQSSATPVLEASSLPRPMSVAKPVHSSKRHWQEDSSTASIVTQGPGKPMDKYGASGDTQQKQHWPSLQEQSPKFDNSVSALGASTPPNLIRNSIANEYHTLLNQEEQDQIFADTERFLAAEESMDDGQLFPDPLFSWRNDSFKKHTPQRSDGRITVTAGEADEDLFHTRRSRFGSLTESDPLSTLVGSRRRRSTSGTIPISPPFGFDNGLSLEASLFNTARTSENIELVGKTHRQSSLPNQFAFSPPATPKVPPTPILPTISPKPSHPHANGKSVQAFPLESSAPPTPPTPTTSSLHPLISSATRSTPSISQPIPISPFSPLSPEEIARASASAAKWGDSLSAGRPPRPPHLASSPATTHRRKSSRKIETLTTAIAAASPTRKAANTLFAALGKAKAGTVTTAHHAHSASAPHPEGSGKWAPKPMQRYPTLGSTEEVRKAPTVVPTLVATGGEKEKHRADADASAKQSRKEKRDEKRKAELKSSIRLVGDNTNGSPGGWI